MTGIVRHTHGPRLYVAGERIHHGSAGCAVALVGLVCRDLLLTMAVIAMVVDDLADFPWRDRDNHAPVSPTGRVRFGFRLGAKLPPRTSCANTRCEDQQCEQARAAE